MNPEDWTTLSDVPTVKIGRRESRGPTFGRYVDAVEIARGGMGRVLRAVDPELGRPVAIKEMLGPAVAGQPRTVRFFREAQITGQLVHPAVPPVHELGRTDDGRPYLVMKLIEGATLAEVVAGQRSLSVEGRLAGRRELLSSFLRVCDCLAFAHSRGVVHRDLKPANIMIGEFGEVLVLDWGIARLVGETEAAGPIDLRAESQGDRTADGTIVGTLSYMAPEQASGDLDGIGPWTDVYGLGAVLYSLLTLEPPVTGVGRGEAIHIVLSGRIEAPSRRAPEARIPKDLDALVGRAMARRIKDRYPSAAELRADVEAYLSGHVLAAVEYSPLERLVKWVRRNRAVSAVGAAAAALVAAALVGLALALFEAREQTEQATRNQALAEERAASESRAKGVAEQLAIDLEQRIEHEADLGDRFRLEDIYAGVWGGPADRFEEWLAGWQRLGGRLATHRTLLAAMASRAVGVDAEGLPTFLSPTDRWFYDRQLTLIDGIEWYLRSKDAWEYRLERLREMEAAMESAADAWRSACRSVAADPRYGGFELRPTFPLLPIGPDPESGLQEFVHLDTGPPAARGPDGRARVDGEVGLVFVLVPPGHLVRPDRRTPVAAFFISKYEMTQGQWLRLGGRNTSRFASSNEGPYTLAHPIESISYEDCGERFVPFHLALPAHAEWEYAARAGREGIALFSDGDDPARLRSFANLAGASDGFEATAPVGSLAANRFGLHDVHGNVGEWVAESSVENPEWRIARGGAWDDPPGRATLETGFSFPLSTRTPKVGVRPVLRP